MDKNDALTMGEVAQRSGTAPSALRYYESLGLLTATRTTGNQRRYHRSALRRIAVIRAAQHVGLSLAQIQDVFAGYPPDHAPTKREWVRIAQRCRPLLDARIRELEAVRDGLSACVGCGCLTMRQCAIYNPKDELADTGAGARRRFPDLDEAAP